MQKRNHQAQRKLTKRMAITLHVSLEVPGETKRTFDLHFDDGPISIGRDSHNEVHLPLSTISRKHARLYRVESDWWMEDLHSTHGTKVNSHHVGSGGKKLLRDGDVIQVMHAHIVFSEAQANSEIEEDKTAFFARAEVGSLLQKAHEHPYLRIMNGPKEGTEIELDPNTPEIIIGRSAGADVQLSDVNISREHTKVRREWGEVQIEDLGSKNGTLVNGKPATSPTTLSDGDEIEIGAIYLTYVDKTGRDLSLPQAPMEEIAPLKEPMVPEEKEAPMAPLSPEPAPATMAQRTLTPEHLILGAAALVLLALVVSTWLLLR